MHHNKIFYRVYELSKQKKVKIYIYFNNYTYILYRREKKNEAYMFSHYAKSRYGYLLSKISLIYNTT